MDITTVIMVMVETIIRTTMEAVATRSKDLIMIGEAIRGEVAADSRTKTNKMSIQITIKKPVMK